MGYGGAAVTRGGNVDEQHRRLLTVEEFAALPQGADGIEELVAGHVYRFPVPGLAHGECLGQLGCQVLEYVRPRRLGRCSVLSGLVVGRDPDSVLCPDFQFWSADRPPVPGLDWPETPPRLVAEVVYGVSEYNHAMLKVPYYLAFGIDVVWLVGLRRRVVDVHRLRDHPQPFDPWEWRYRGFSRATAFRAEATLDGGDVLPGFSCRVADLFA